MAANHQIPLAEAVEMTRRYRESVETRSVSFPRAPVDELLKQPGCAGIRIYPARKADSKLTYVLVGTDDQGNDMTEGILIDDGYPCPPICPDGSALNG